MTANRSEGLHEFICADAGLLEYTRERADLQFAVLWHDATSRATAQNHVTAFLAKDYEAKFLQCTNSVRTRNVRKTRRHEP